MDDIDKTIPPQRGIINSGADDETMPGKRDRKPDGRFAVGDLIMNRYKVLAELGQGGMGVVYKCFDDDAGIEVALKALHFTSSEKEAPVPAPAPVSPVKPEPKPKKVTVALENQELAKIDCNGVLLEMVKIKAGTFTMGSPEGELGRSRDETQHQVTLTKDYWLGKFEVTQAQYEAIMGNNPSYFKGGNRPVEEVSWEDAKEFCNKLNERYAGKLPTGYRFDLPTEAQWEYACRAGTTTALNNGTNLTSEKGECSNLNEVGWYKNNHGSGGHKAVGQKRPNNWGLYDMHGNVMEWCRDWRTFYTGDATDPTGPASGSRRVNRGGSWDDYASGCRSACRGSLSPAVATTASASASPSSQFNDWKSNFLGGAAGYDHKQHN